MDWKQETAKTTENQLGTFQYIKQGVRQNSVISPVMFNLYSELIKGPYKTIHSRIEDLANKNTLTYSDRVKPKEGALIMANGSILDIWFEFVKELYNFAYDEQCVVKYNSEEPHILKMEVQNALKLYEIWQESCPHNVTTEMNSALELGIDQITRQLNAIYDTGDKFPNLCKSIVIAIPK